MTATGISLMHTGRTVQLCNQGSTTARSQPAALHGPWPARRRQPAAELSTHVFYIQSLHGSWRLQAPPGAEIRVASTAWLERTVHNL